MIIKIMILLVLSAFIFSKSFKLKDDNNSAFVLIKKF